MRLVDVDKLGFRYTNDCEGCEYAPSKDGDCKGLVCNKVIERMPTAVPEIHSHWVYDGWGFFCDRCRKDLNNTKIIPQEFRNKHNFCPDCGAIMDEPMTEEKT